MTEPCGDCGAEVTDHFCGHCGQKRTAPPRDVRLLLSEFFGAWFNLEGKLFRTLWALIRHPGMLTTEYFAGRRTRYFTPLRLYLTVSVIFFTLASIVPSGATKEFKRGFTTAKPSSQQTTELAAGKTFVTRKLSAFVALDKDKQYALLDAAMKRLVSETPKILFVSLPLFALFFKLAFRRRYYAESFVFVLHLHALVFLAYTVALPIPDPWDGIPTTLPFLTALVAMKRVYAESWTRTVLKSVALFLAYSATALVVFVSLLFAFVEVTAP